MNTVTVLALLSQMRQACCHRALVTSNNNATNLEAARAAVTRDLDNLRSSFDETQPACRLCPELVTLDRVSDELWRPRLFCDGCIEKEKPYVEAGLEFSTKIRRCLNLLLNIRAGKTDPPHSKDKQGSESTQPTRPHKTIIFSQFTSFFNILQPFLDIAGFLFVRLDGSMNTEQRAEALERIKRDDDKYTVILISIKTGSVGLNLTCCSRVILLEPWWNSALEDQAFAR
jgi:SNF2 family DNA or RNA helicase